jgi:DNA-binding response OmpR family regulator
MKILLVDDEKRFVLFLSKRLALRGIDTDYANSGEEAVAKVTDHHYDVAVLDVKMPGISGIDLERKLRLLAPDMKTIFLTGHGSETDFKIRSAESAHYLSKPINIERLLEELKNVMGKSSE